jgi:hypothetical protein
MYRAPVPKIEDRLTTLERYGLIEAGFSEG